MKNWVVVANAARARILEAGVAPGDCVQRADLVHTQSRQKGVELRSERSGHIVGGPSGSGGAAYSPRTDVRDLEHERFAREVAQAINEGVAAGGCAGLILVASNPFLGRLKSHLSPQASKALLETLPSDCTSLSDGEIAQRLSNLHGLSR